jgi:hypothetical protein
VRCRMDAESHPDNKASPDAGLKRSALVLLSPWSVRGAPPLILAAGMRNPSG